MKKKRMPLFGAILMLFCMALFPAEHARAEVSGSTSDGYITMSTDATSLNEGDTVEVKLYVKDVIISYLAGYLEYDTEVFNELKTKDITFNEDACADVDFSVTFANRINKMTFMSGGGQASSIEGDGLFATIRLTVKKAVPSTTIEFNDIAVVNEKIEDLEYGGLSFTINNSAYGASSNRFALSSDSVQNTADSDVSVPLNIAENTGINALGITVRYDKSVCDYRELTVADAFADKIALQSVYEAPGGGEIRASFISKDNITDTGNFANLSFRIKDEAAAGTTADITVEIVQVTNKEETDVTGTGTSAKITVQGQPQEPSAQTGDVNGDGKIDLTDAVYVLLAYNGEKTLTAPQQTAADVNGDSSVNLQDALQIMRYFNQEITAFGI